jgi:hypothetical protein
MQSVHKPIFSKSSFTDGLSSSLLLLTGVLYAQAPLGTISNSDDDGTNPKDIVEFLPDDLFANGFEGEPPFGALVINEVDYDQPLQDMAEFVELYNRGPAAARLTGLELTMVNGSNGDLYATHVLPDFVLEEGHHFVVCSDTASVLNCDLRINGFTVQNGPADAVALMDGQVILDTVSYEGDAPPPWTEGTGVVIGDSGSIGGLGLSRSPDGVDTDVNNADWILACITPGSSNSQDSIDCHVSPDAGDVVITEIMPNPSAVGDNMGEWFELKNVSGNSVSLAGCSISDNAFSHDIVGTLNAGASEVLLFAVNGELLTNGGLAGVDYVYAGLALSNTSDSLTLKCASGDIDAVVFDSASFPFGVGVSMQLDPDYEDQVANNIPVNWCAGSAAYGDGDMGTPGEQNLACP